MIWTYRVFCDKEGRYSIREVFCERDGTIINYGKTPVVLAGASIAELMQLAQWFKEAFDLPVLSLEEIDAQLAKPAAKESLAHGRRTPLDQVMAELAADADPVSQS
ncbi:MAG: hypothetical protein HC929_06830 [Leptolyngbyaceae cyanobacterium SM2_5_2]|nr:hypothetical protein [Leptolyngbyaceae cyanobacterium SM2_5_2]